MGTKEISTKPPKRLYSLDALRGFDMFWITGGGMLAITVSDLTGFEWLGVQMEHVKWDGFHFYDLIFPLFMFIAGVAIPLSVKARLDRNVPKKKLLKKVFYRMVALVLLGLVYNGVFKTGFAGSRFASVLGQIGIAYFFASLIVIYFKTFKARLIWLGGILAGYAMIQLLIPVPGFGAGVLTPEGSINSFIDRLFLPGRLYGGTFDPEGLLCIISATGITLMGTVAGNILRRKDKTDWQKISYLSATGAGLIISALIISPFYPIIKACWTTSFNLLAGGISFLLIALFYLIIDHWGFKSWSFYFRVIGMNSIFVYMFRRIINMQDISEFFFGWLSNPESNYGKLIIIIGAIALTWLLLYYMYKKKIFLKV
ncbi:MAG: DUF5009 domain-containing protein [Chlorobi bacterium]|nr:DUF5009 domain-containing protein [Chlorobiota bacterium]